MPPLAYIGEEGNIQSGSVFFLSVRASVIVVVIHHSDHNIHACSRTEPPDDPSPPLNRGNRPAEASEHGIHNHQRLAIEFHCRPTQCRALQLLWRRGCLCVCRVDVLYPND